MKRNWKRIGEIAKKVVDKNGKFESVAELARDLEIPASTMKDAFSRGELVFEELVTDVPEPQEKPVKAQIRGNTAKIKYNAAEPLNSKELLEVAGLNSEEWKIVSQDITAWQMGRKKKKVDLNFIKGVSTGSVKDTGKIHKEYLYRINVTATRINRVAVKATLNPISINFKEPETDFKWNPLDGKNEIEILFLADPHFGFERLQGNQLLPFQDREFLGGLLSVSSMLNPDLVIWNGDALDLPDVSSFITDPAILQNVQYAGIELAWLQRAFAEHTRKQIYLEGNHEERLERAMKKNFQSAFGLKPIHDLGGEDLMSIPRFLGLDQIGVEWVGGYPENNYRIGNVIFSHGNTVRKGSGRTVAAEINDATLSRFFGHIHRTELAAKTIADQGNEIFIGSPGCSCIKGRVPGSKKSSNWQTGAFYITMSTDGNVSSVELISKGSEGGSVFRGMEFFGNYFERFVASLEGEIKNLFQFSPIT